jgi:hypothetical protein
MDLADFGGLDIGPTDTIAQPPNLYPKLAVYGDSYTEGAANPLQGQQVIAYSIGSMLSAGPPLIPFKCGQGGAGYINNPGGGKAPYTDSSRLAGLYSTGADIVIVIGSVNDNGQTQGAVQTAVSTVLAGIRTNMPNAKLICVGVQPEPTSLAGAAFATVNAGVAAAASAYGVPLIDWYNSDIITGSGNSGSLASNGNADIMIYSDGVHPVPGPGTDYEGRWLAAQISALL